MTGDDPQRIGRIAAIILAVAAGEAMGRATEHYTPAEIDEIYEDAVTDFVEPVRLFDGEVWVAAETGDLTAALVGEGPVDGVPFAAGLRAGLLGTMDSAPLPAVEAALAVALATALAGRPLFEMIEAAAGAAGGAGDIDLKAAILRAAGTAQASGGRRPGAALREAFPPDGEGLSVLAFALGVAYAAPNGRRAILEAVNQGGHSPTAAALAGALAAALAPNSIPSAWANELTWVNGIDFANAARRLCGLPSAEPESNA